MPNINFCLIIGINFDGNHHLGIPFGKLVFYEIQWNFGVFRIEILALHYSPIEECLREKFLNFWGWRVSQKKLTLIFRCFQIGSWSYQSDFVRLVVDEPDVFLGDFYDNQEWLLVSGFRVSNFGYGQKFGSETFESLILVPNGPFDLLI